MISIIISSYNEENFENIKTNIQETIGIPYELIQIWNPGTFSINEAYEKGLGLSKYDNLLFIHEDLVFLDQNWGQELLKGLLKEDLGLMGLAGSSYLPGSPIDWFISESYNYINIFQGVGQRTLHLKNFKEDSQQVLALDGVFLFGRKTVFQEIGFDQNIKGFHAYDLSISLRTAAKYKNYVINTINVHHISEGKPNIDWFNSTLAVRESLNYSFPHSQDNLVENAIFRRFSENTIKYWGKSYKSYKKIMQYYPSRNLEGVMEKVKLNWFLIKLFAKKSDNNIKNNEYKTSAKQNKLLGFQKDKTGKK